MTHLSIFTFFFPYPTLVWASCRACPEDPDLEMEHAGDASWWASAGAGGGEGGGSKTQEAQGAKAQTHQGVLLQVPCHVLLALWMGDGTTGMQGTMNLIPTAINCVVIDWKTGEGMWLTIMNVYMSQCRGGGGGGCCGILQVISCPTVTCEWVTMNGYYRYNESKNQK